MQWPASLIKPEQIPAARFVFSILVLTGFTGDISPSETQSMIAMVFALSLRKQTAEKRTGNTQSPRDGALCENSPDKQTQWAKKKSLPARRLTARELWLQSSERAKAHIHAPRPPTEPSLHAGREVPSPDHRNRTLDGSIRSLAERKVRLTFQMDDGRLAKRFVKLRSVDMRSDGGQLMAYCFAECRDRAFRLEQMVEIYDTESGNRICDSFDGWFAMISH